MPRKVIQRTLGGPEVLELINEPEFDPAALRRGEVLVAVAAAGLNAVDAKVRAGTGGPPLGQPPFTVGWDLAGTVRAVGPGVAGFKAGDRVAAFSRFPKEAAAYGDYAVTDAGDLAAIPATVPFEAAAAIPLAGLTAWQALTDVAHVEAGQRVLIHGAGGGVGHLAVQLAHGLGAHVIATASSGKRDWVMSLGADQFIDYTSEDFTAELATDPVDLTLDFIGKSVGVGSAAVTRPGGLILQFNDGVDEESRSVADAAGVRIAGPAVHIDKPQLDQLVKKLNAGELRVTVAKAFDLADIAKAHAALDAGHAAGKIVLRMN